MKLKLNELQEQVGEWARMNFGANESKVKVGDQTEEDYPWVVLQEVAPFLGLVEEFGEFGDAENPIPGQKADIEEVRELQQDALGDIGIYLLDFTSRINIPIEEIANATVKIEFKKHPYQELSVRLGRIAHALLKHHQGIRGMDNHIHYDTEMRIRLAELIHALKVMTPAMFGREYWDIVEETWEKIVVKRNWKANKQDGVTAQGFSGSALSEPEEQGIDNLGSV